MMNGNNDLLVVANWKMNFSHDESLAFVANHYSDFCNLTSMTKSTTVLCPLFTTLYPLQAILKDSQILIGAQDCSSHTKGAFTGQVSAQSLKSLGCSYCIVGHSERRKHNGETNAIIAQKALLLVDQGITPIICVGENSQEFEQGITLAVLEQQLSPVLDAFTGQKFPSTHAPLCIAYEPIWSIGTGKVSGYQHLEVVFSWLHRQTQRVCPGVSWKLLYGGSVTSQSAAEIKKVSYIGGFLVGGASLDFQEFKKIVECGEWRNNSRQ